MQDGDIADEAEPRRQEDAARSRLTILRQQSLARLKLRRARRTSRSTIPAQLGVHATFGPGLCMTLCAL